jgi:hypothetical protein
MTLTDVPVADCDLCVADKGVFDFGRVCCCARYVCSIPLKRLRAGWMELFRERNDAEFFEQLECAVRARWINNKNTKGAGDGAG